MARSMKEVHTINYYSINEGAARRAKEMNSFSDYKEGSATAEYRAMVDKAAAIAEQQKSRGTIDIPEHIQNYFDYEAYGRDVRINEGGVFAPGGYVSAVPEGFKEYYHGPQDIPPEHRIFAYPEKAEPVHSILATLKRFQEAPPAPKKDKAGPSHEER